MLEVHRLAGEASSPTATLTLPFDARQKSRQRATLDGGAEVGLFLPRGTVLRDGDLLEATDGTIVAVKAAVERVSRVTASTPLALVRAAYHLGNRHVALQVEEGAVSYRHDHVLDDMVRGLGLEVQVIDAPFEPEPGAYAPHAHHHHD
ncbi:MAG: urease accessory protein UreE [Myxococcota bacterium]